jgi:hypothetical protein
MPTQVQLPDGNIGEFPDGMSHEQIESALQRQYPKQSPPQPDAASRFGSAAAAPVAGAVGGVYHAVTDPAHGGVEKAAQVLGPGALFLKRMLVDPAIAQGENAVFDARLGRYSEAAGHGLAALLPGVGPAAAQFAETEGKELGAGDYAGAFGTLVGNAAVMFGPKMLGRGADALNKTSESMRRGITGTGPKATAEAVTKAKAGNALADAHIKAQAAIETARNNALKEGNAKYSTVNEKLNDYVADPDKIAGALGDAQGKIKGSNTEPTIYKDILKKTDKGGMLTYKDLQGYYSELGKELTKGTLPGDVYAAYDTLHESIGNEMQRIADENGQGAQLKDAQNYWRRMKQAFGKPLGQSDVATQVLNSQSPEMAQQAETANRVRLLGSFDPEIPKAFEDIGKARAAAKDAPTVLPGETAKLGPEEVRQAKTDSLQKRAGQAREVGNRLVRYGVGLKALWDAFHLNVEGMGQDVGIAGAAYGLSHMAAKALENPNVVDFLTKPTPADIAQIPPEMRGNFPAIMQAAKARGIKIDPRITAVLGITALNGPKARKLKDLSEAYRTGTQ